MLTKSNIKNIYSLTPMQEGMLFHSVSEQTSAYNVQIVFTLKGEVDKGRMEKAINLLISKYDTFRSVFSFKKSEKPRQIVLKERKLSVYYEDISQLDDQEKFIDNFKKEERSKVFTLSQDLLIKASILKIKSDESLLILVVHHILFDGWCLRKITDDLFSFYFDQKNPDASVLIERRLKEAYPYYHFINWLENQDTSASLKYWKDYLDGFETPSRFLRKKKFDNTLHHEIEETWIDENLSTRIKEVSSQLQITINAMLQSCWGILFSKYIHAEDIVFGTVVSGRPPELAGVEEIVGLLINTIPMRMKIEKDLTYKELAQQVHAHFNKSQQYSYSPLTEIQAQTEVRNELIDHIFIMENYPVETNDDPDNKDSLSIKNMEFVEETNYDFNVIVNPGDRYRVIFNYNKALFPAYFTKRLIRHYINVISQVVNNPAIKIADISLATKDEKEFLLKNCCVAPLSAYPANRSITDIFEEIAVNYANHTALRSEYKIYFYGELNAKANQLAHTLIKKGIRKEDVVALLMERSPELVIAELAILKAGGAYLPIDTKYPSSQVKNILNDSGAKVVLVQSAVLLEKYDLNVPYLLMDDNLYDNDLTNPSVSNLPHNLAYVMYTSGSTGKPKGAMIEHRNVVRLVKNTNYLAFSPDICTIQGGAPSFDASTFEIWGPLLNGGTVCTVDEQDMLDAVRLKSKIEKFNVNTLWLTSSLFSQLTEDDASIFSSLKYLLSGGDVLSPKHVNTVRNENPHLNVINLYGPTENTTFSTYFPIEKEYNESIPIGYPISNSTCYIVDENMQLLPIGVIGEVCVGGDGVGRGYIGNTDGTNSKFIENPYHPGRLYKTGDMAYWLDDGSMQFVGRRDSQVKIRGFRVELADIELKANAYPGVKQSVVTIVGDKDICLYIEVRHSVDVDDLKAYLKQELPIYMMPLYIVQLDNFLLNSNGKIDRKKLPLPQLNKQAGYKAPVDSLEKELQGIWYQLFNMNPDSETISTDDDFFKLGGHSMKAMKLASVIGNTLQLDIPVNAVFENTTIKDLAVYIRKMQAGTANDKLSVPPLVPAPKASYYELTPTQRTFIYQYSPDNLANSICNAFAFRKKIDTDRFRDIIREISRRHELLRARYEFKDGKYIMRVEDDVEPDIEIEYVNGDEEKIRDSVNHFFRPFDFTKELPYKIKIICTAEIDILAIHSDHSILDGTGLGVFFKEYIMLNEGAELPLPAIQYRDFALWQQKLIKSDYIKPQREFWHNLMKLPVSPLKFPIDIPEADLSLKTSRTFEFKVNTGHFEDIQRYAANSGITLQMYFTSLVGILMHKYTGQEDILFVYPMACRKLPEFAEVIGLFCETFPMRFDVKPEKSIRDYLGEVKKISVAVINNQDFPFDVLREELGLSEREIAYDSLFGLGFSYLDTEIAGGNLEDFGISHYPLKLEADLRFPLLIQIMQQKDNVTFLIDYRTSMFKPETIQRLSEMIIRYSNKIVADDGRLMIGDL